MTLDDVKHTLSGYARFQYTNNSPKELDQMYFHIWPNAYKDDLTDFAIQNNSNYKTIKFLNPWLRGKKLPNTNGSNYTIKLPSEDSNLDPVETNNK